MSDEKPKSKAVTFFIRVLTALGLLQLYNIVGYYQTLIELSESFKFIADWWHYLVQQAFEFLHIHIPRWAREIVVLFLFASSVANLQFYREYRELLPVILVSQVIDLVSNPRIDTPEEVRLRHRNLETMGLSGLVIAALFSFIPYMRSGSLIITIPLAIAAWIICIYARYYLSTFKLPDLSKPPLKVLRIAGFIIMFPLSATLWWGAALARYRVEILKNTRFLLIFLAADLACRYGLDPLLAIWPELPKAPPSN